VDFEQLKQIVKGESQNKEGTAPTPDELMHHVNGLMAPDNLQEEFQ
jgi:hypothetical protein